MAEMLDCYNGDGPADWAQMVGHVDAVMLKATEASTLTASRVLILAP